jgi:hypothetical protein
MYDSSFPRESKIISQRRPNVGILIVNSSEGRGLRKIPSLLISLDSEWIISGELPSVQVVEAKYRASLMVNPPSLK